MHACQIASVVLDSDFMDRSPPGFSVQGILQARILEWVAMPFSRGSSQPRDPTHISPPQVGGFFTTSATWEAPTCALVCLSTNL